jgi:hypothetical protein
MIELGNINFTLSKSVRIGNDRESYCIFHAHNHDKPIMKNIWRYL